MSDSFCKRVMPLSYGRSFPPVFRVFFRNVTGMYELLSSLLWYVGYCLLIICKRVLFRVIFETISVFFLFHRYCYNNFCFVGFYQGLLYHERLIQKRIFDEILSFLREYLQLEFWYMCLQGTKQ